MKPDFKVYVLTSIMLTFTISASMAQGNTTVLPDKPEPDVVIIFSDGNANAYELKNNVLTYYPVTQEMSSSGMYDGGDAWEVAVTRKAYRKLARAVNKVTGASGDHISTRLMGSGLLAIRLSENAKEQQWILAPGSQSLDQLILLFSGMKP